MRLTRLLASAIGVAAGILLGAPAIAAHAADEGDGGGRVVFVQTNNPAANAIVAYRRTSNGSLAQAAVYPTGGRGGREVGSVSDPLASQGSLIRSGDLLLNVNAGSDTVSVFHVQGERLDLEQVVASGGSFPTGIAVHGDLVYVLNAGLTGGVSGYRLSGSELRPIPGSTRSLGLANATPPFFLTSPAQVGFTPDGRQLIVTTKTNSTVDVFSVERSGRLSAEPVRNPEAGVPFAFLFRPGHQLDLLNAGTSSIAPITVNDDGSISPAGTPVSDGQAAACWIATARGFAYVANTGSGTVSQFRIEDGQVTLVNPVAASVPGAIDMAASGRYLYAESGATASVDVFAIGENGSLTLLQVLPVAGGASLEGIAIG